MVSHCWASVEDGGPTMTQHQVNALCLLGSSPWPEFEEVWGTVYVCARERSQQQHDSNPVSPVF